MYAGFMSDIMAERTKSIKGAQLPKYGKLMEEYLNKGKTTEKAHKIASSPIMLRPDKFDKPSLVDKAILAGLRKVKRLRKKP